MCIEVLKYIWDGLGYRYNYGFDISIELLVKTVMLYSIHIHCYVVLSSHNRICNCGFLHDIPKYLST